MGQEMEYEGLADGRDRPVAKGWRTALPRATPLRVSILVSARLEVEVTHLIPALPQLMPTVDSGCHSTIDSPRPPSLLNCRSFQSALS